MSSKFSTWEGFLYHDIISQSSTKKKIQSPENLRVIVEIRVKDNDHCHHYCRHLKCRGAVSTCGLFNRHLDRHYGDHIRHKLCKEDQYVG